MQQPGFIAAGLSDTGLARQQNEDRIHLDARNGIFIVADGLGGHAAGEKAAQTAIDVISSRLKAKSGAPADRIREAISVANNEILRLANEDARCEGMASVVTLAVIEGDTVHAGHVGDSRMYVLERGSIRKVTHDHSPVGELEDSGRLTEAEAMAHPRRNEVYRDLGSEPRTPNEPDFIEVVSFPFHPKMALLICSDGLSDQVRAAEMQRIVEARAGNPKAAARELVEAANRAGGKDNVSAVLVEGTSYGVPAETPAPRPPSTSRAAPLLVGFLLGLACAGLAWMMLGRGTRVNGDPAHVPQTLRVGGGGIASISEALKQANAGDTIVVGPGKYAEEVRLVDGVAVVNEPRRSAAITNAEVIADHVQGARMVGFELTGTGAVGVRILGANIELTDVAIEGKSEAGILVEGESQAQIRANTITRNPGTGVIVKAAAAPSITNNVITDNGREKGALRPGLRITGTAAPVVNGNVIGNSGLEPVWVSPLFDAARIEADNFLAPGAKDRKTLVKVVSE